MKSVILREFTSIQNKEYLRGAIYKYMSLCCCNAQILQRKYEKYICCFENSFSRFTDEEFSRLQNNIGAKDADIVVLVKMLNTKFLKTHFVQLDKLRPRQEMVYTVGDGYATSRNLACGGAPKTVEQKLAQWKTKHAPSIMATMRDDARATNIEDQLIEHSDTGIEFYNSRPQGSWSSENEWSNDTNRDNIDYGANHLSKLFKAETGFLGAQDRAPREKPKDFSKCDLSSNKEFDLTDELDFNVRMRGPSRTKDSDIFKKNEAGVVNGVPQYRMKTHARNFDRDQSENLDGFERENDYTSGYNMNPLKKKVAYRATKIDQLKGLAGIEKSH